MKYFLSIEFENQGDLNNYKVNDIISFISFKGLFKNGIIKEIRYFKDGITPIEYVVDCEGKDFIAVSDYVFKKNAPIFNVQSNIKELENGFPLRT